MDIVRAMPWWVKLAAKLILARLPISYSVWRRLGLFKHGDMLQGQHARISFESNFKKAMLYQKIPSEFTYLEIGPGDSLLAGLVAKSCGATKCYFVDNGSYVQKDIQPYKKLAVELGNKRLNVPEIERCQTFSEFLEVCNFVYLKNGVKSMAKIETDSIDFIWSSVVLEHIARTDFSKLAREMKRIIKPHGVSSHSIDLKDHLGASLNNLRFNERNWERKIIKNSGLYTNRLRMSEIIEKFECAGFKIAQLKKFMWDSLPLPKTALAKQFQKFSEKELRVREFEIVLVPVEENYFVKNR